MPTAEMQYSPSRAVALLDELQRGGFSDSSFQILHHFGRKATIQSYYDYCCDKVNNFNNDGTNELVCKRLAMVLSAFRAAAFSAPAKPGIFEALALAARLEIPIE